jgi:RHS repeat-associated protein
VVQTLDYCPYGSTRISVATSTIEKRQFIGQFKDDSTLSYLQARYYEASRGQFMSEDPLFWSPGQALQDPQSLNSYSYANNSPIVKSDPMGKYAVDYTRPVDQFGFLSNFSHAFVYVAPQPGEVLPPIYSNGMCIDTSQPFVMGGFPVGVPGLRWQLVTRANDSYDYSIAARNQSVPGVGRAVITPPDGMSAADYDLSLVKSFNSMSVDQGGYNPSGTRRIFGSSNSNNFNTSLLMNSGLSQKGMNQVTGQLGQNSRPAPGLGTSMSAPTYSQSAISAIIATLQSISAMLSSMIKGSGK